MNRVKLVSTFVLLLVILSGCSNRGNSEFITTPNEENVNPSSVNDSIVEGYDSLKEWLLGEDSSSNNESETIGNTETSIDTDEAFPDEYEAYKGNKIVKSETCDLDGDRESMVKVDIGVDSNSYSRDYYAYTNEHSQLVLITAEEITAQDDSKEDVTSKGRYCSDEAKVPGTESYELDEGHGIADSLGGASNSYNITPQNSGVNRTGGEQYAFEEEIRDALYNGHKIEDFIYIIKYPTNNTQIPNSYYVSYKIDGESVTYEFNN